MKSKLATSVEPNKPRNSFLSPTDLIVMGLLCVVFSFLVFFRLGNMKAPETYLQTSVDNNEINLDFGKNTHIDKLNIYLGNLHDRKIWIYAYDEEKEVWKLIVNEKAEKVFRWNVLTLDADTRYLSVICGSDDGVFNEFVFTDEAGNIITPENADEYEALFDEQDLMYDTSSPTYMTGTMFDEIYHGRTGYEFVHGLTTYETTHPHLGKLLIALGIKMFGMTPFGMRFFPAVFGLLFIPLMYIFSKRLFDSTIIASVAGFLITFDCMHYTLSRIATIDIFVAFFIVASYYFMYEYIKADTAYRKEPIALAPPSRADRSRTSSSKNTTFTKFPPARVFVPLGLSGVMMAFGIATKFTGIFGGMGLAVILIAHLIKYPPKKQTLPLFFYCFAIFIVLTLSVYTLSNIPTVENTEGKDLNDTSITFEDGWLHIGYGCAGLIAKTLRNTNYMVYYHSHLDSEHVYQSPFYMWPLDRIPLVASYQKTNDSGMVSSVSYVGNPAVWLAEIPCILFMFFVTAKNLFIWIKNFFAKEKKEYDVIPLFLTAAYLAQYIPWFGVSRITFIYHYLPSVIFGMLTICYTLKTLLAKWPKAKYFVFVYLGVVIIFFCIYFPLISGYPESSQYWHAIADFGGWK